MPGSWFKAIAFMGPGLYDFLSVLFSAYFYYYFSSSSL
jgi:hypothetical protein